MQTPASVQSRHAILDRPGLRQHWLSLSPVGFSGLDTQVEAVYDAYRSFLVETGLTSAHVVLEKVYCRSVGLASELLDRARSSRTGRPTPAMYIEQPPAEPSHEIELQVHLVQPGSDPERLENLPDHVDGVRYTVGDSRFIHVSGLTGAGADGTGSFVEKTRLMFERARLSLNSSGFDFRDVVRTWIYLSDLERDYDAFNGVRTAFFQETDVCRIPASTGIQGIVYPETAGPGMDLLAIDPDGKTRIRVMHASTMNEASSYGSAFSRAMEVSFSGQSLAYVSGTASINERGEIVGRRDIEAQLRRMQDNVAALLDPVGASLEDAVNLTVFLKDPSFLPAFKQSCDFPDSIPLSVVIADVCRPGWLCEMEAIVAV